MNLTRQMTCMSTTIFVSTRPLGFGFGGLGVFGLSFVLTLYFVYYFLSDLFCFKIISVPLFLVSRLDCCCCQDKMIRINNLHFDIE